MPSKVSELGSCRLYPQCSQQLRPFRRGRSERTASRASPERELFIHFSLNGRPSPKVCTFAACRATGESFKVPGSGWVMVPMLPRANRPNRKLGVGYSTLLCDANSVSSAGQNATNVNALSLPCLSRSLTTTNSAGRKSASALQWIGFGLKLSSCTGQVNHSNFARKPEK